MGKVAPGYGLNENVNLTHDMRNVWHSGWGVFCHDLCDAQRPRCGQPPASLIEVNADVK